MMEAVALIAIIFVIVGLIYFNYTNSACGKTPLYYEGFAGSQSQYEEQTGLNASPDYKMEIGRNSQLPVKRGDGGYGGINGQATSLLSFNRDVSNLPQNYGPDYPPTLGSEYTVDPSIGNPTNSVQGAVILKNVKKVFDNSMPYAYTPVVPKYPDDCYSAYWF